MRIAITGASGNIGTAVRNVLERDAAITEIVGIARRRPVSSDGSNDKTRWYSADIANDDLRPFFTGCDAVIALGWQFHPSRRPNVTWRANVTGSSHTFAAAADAGVGTIVYTSSLGAYSPGRGRVDESWPTDSLPTAAYGREKAYVERVLDAFEAEHSDVRVVRFRPTFVLQRPAAGEQRRIFAGPFVPGVIAEPDRLPFLPFPAGLRFQAVHADDVASAVALALHSDARGPFNLAAEPVIDRSVIADVLQTRVITVPDAPARWAIEIAWALGLVPVQPALFELVLQLPLLDTERARTVLQWHPQYRSVDALRALLSGVRAGAGGDTPPLQPDSFSERLHEVATGMGARDV